MSSPDVAVIGGGIIGTAAAALLAEAGASVVLFEATAIGAGASGRNSGVIQHPYDRALAQLHTDSLASYRALDAVADGFALPSAPAGILLVTTDDGVIAETTERLAKATPELEPQAIAIGQAGLIEPELAADVGGCLLRTGYPVVPAAATDAFARRARRAGVSMRIGESAAPVIDDHRAVGVSAGESEILPAGQVLVAAGPWTPALVPGWQAQPPIGRSWGVVVSTVLPRPLRWVLEEETIDERGSAEPYASSLVTAAGASSVGSTFLGSEPDPAALAPEIMRRASRFVPALGSAPINGLRACARPVSADGRPLIGSVPGVAGLFVCAGHGPWGISTGPASARLVADHMLAGAEVPAALDAARVTAAG